MKTHLLLIFLVMAAANWLARDIAPEHEGAVDLLLSSGVSVDQLVQAKDAFKTLRIVGETSEDRRLGARPYAASIAAALVHHGTRISRQSDAALRRALGALADDRGMPQALRTLAGNALSRLAGA